MTLQDAINAIEPVDEACGRRAQAHLDRLTKPVGSLGRLEELAARYVAMTRDEAPKPPRAAIFTLAADHGVAVEGVSAYPSAVTAQMVVNFLRGGAAVNVLAAHAHADVRVVDIGVAHEFGPVAGLIAKKVALGTRNFLVEPAMSRAQAEAALAVGVELADSASREGIGVIGTGEMGIGNTTASAAMTAVMTGLPPGRVTGRGTGVDDEAWKKKIAVIEHALALHRPAPTDPVGVLAAVGGFEIAGLAGLILGAAAHRMPVVLDGFIAGAAALIAAQLQPRSTQYMLASHLSVECGHDAALERLGLRPLLNLDLRLGEGTGACLALNLLHAALKILTSMATFQEAGVSERAP